MWTRRMVWAMLLVSGMLVCADVAHAGGWAPVDMYTAQGSNTMRGLLRLILALASIAVAVLFLALRGFDTMGVGAAVSLGFIGVFLLGVMDPIINGIAAAGTPDECAGAYVTAGVAAVPDQDSAESSQDTTMGQGADQTDDRQPAVLDYGDDQLSELEVSGPGRDLPWRVDSLHPAERPCGGDVSSTSPVPGRPPT
jgi:hypothetical protein